MNGVGWKTKFSGHLSPNSRLSLGYQGQFGSKTRNHTGQAQLRVQF